MYEGDIQMEGTVKSLALGKSGQGSEQLAVAFTTDDERHPNVTAYLYFSDASIPFTEKKLIALGWDPSQNNWMLDELVESQSIVGNVVDLVCAEEIYNDKPTLKVKFINEKGGVAMKEKMSSHEASAFSTKLRQRLGVTGGAKKRVTSKASSKKDEEPPF